ncbi:MAG TPA: cation:proton antiporter, partial [Candidatus Polarisedimenticolaceae bacterium]|nr:cation:proton antiporter [Candidatus Polarisedimenticolaceae bacterium]
MTAAQLSALFFLQMAVILAACRALGWIARRVGQPQVMGEMIAGVLLGPSLFGLMFPEVQQRLFPAESLKTLYVGAQLGIGLYMFLVGLDTHTEVLRSRIRGASAAAGASVG